LTYYTSKLLIAPINLWTKPGNQLTLFKTSTTNISWFGNQPVCQIILGGHSMPPMLYLELINKLVN